MDKAKLIDLLERVEKANFGNEVDLALKRAGVNEPSPRGCASCDLGRGTRGMDRCSTCDGTGSVFVIGSKAYPNTEPGYLHAAAEHVRALIART